ncbi:group 1 truncated hemoglobin [Acidithiobacillus sp.]|uniref:group I truncated hemoglobin n=1 Tax=Acidithiobacillus sp. TaxID=1872118 RepID=UPI0025C54852|nr:group 1 truncated hemoglobin [Acidithiobacillus sp.]
MLNQTLYRGVQKWLLLGVAGALTLNVGVAAAADSHATPESIQKADIKLPIHNYIAEFGGVEGVKALIDTFVSKVAADPHINIYFAKTNIPHLKYELTQQVCEIVGGPCTYTGQNMTQAHQGLQVTTAAFNYLAQDMIDAMDERGIPIRAQNYLLRQLAAMEPEVVTAKGPLG